MILIYSFMHSNECIKKKLNLQIIKGRKWKMKRTISFKCAELSKVHSFIPSFWFLFLSLFLLFPFRSFFYLFFLFVAVMIWLPLIRNRGSKSLKHLSETLSEMPAKMSCPKTHAQTWWNCRALGFEETGFAFYFCSPSCPVLSFVIVELNISKAV